MVNPFDPFKSVEEAMAAGRINSYCPSDWDRCYTHGRTDTVTRSELDQMKKQDAKARAKAKAKAKARAKAKTKAKAKAKA